MSGTARSQTTPSSAPQRAMGASCCPHPASAVADAAATTIECHVVKVKRPSLPAPSAPYPSVHGPGTWHGSAPLSGTLSLPHLASASGLRALGSTQGHTREKAPGSLRGRLTCLCFLGVFPRACRQHSLKAGESLYGKQTALCLPGPPRGVHAPRAPRPRWHLRLRGDERGIRCSGRAARRVCM
jgi:hypothetical protein